jgi:hypothetical protein
MPLFNGRRMCALVLVTVAGCSDGKNSTGPRAKDPATTALMSSSALAPATTSTLLGRSFFGDPTEPVFKVRRATGNWHVELFSAPALDVAVQRIEFPAGSNSGWHSHPGPVFIQVVSGTLSFYESNDPTCTPLVLSAADKKGYLDAGDHAHIARNESGAQAQTIVTYLAPPGAALKISQPSPGNCPF